MLDVNAVRRQFPALNHKFDGKPAVFFDTPGGTQVPRKVIDAMVNYLTSSNANTHGLFETSRRSDAMIDNARQAVADLLGADVDEVIFGNNMTSLSFALSHALVHEFDPEDEIVVTRLDHDANIMPWVRMGEDSGATVRWADIDMETGTLDMDHVKSLINPRTKLVSVGYASNATGTINDVATIIGWAKEAGAYSFIDAVQYAPHGAIDVKALDCDFLACSAYKFFGPHVGHLYGKREHLQRLNAYRVRPAGDVSPDKWETGTKNHEGLAGVAAAIDYIAELGVTYGTAAPNDDRRTKILAAWPVIRAYEEMLIDRLISGLQLISGRAHLRHHQSLRLGQARVDRLHPQGGNHAGPACRGAGRRKHLCHQWELLRAGLSASGVGVEPSGGLLRIGLAHYHTLEEIDRCVAGD